MSTRPRNPRHFPKMKVRGARRRQQAPVQRVLRAFDGFGLAVLAAAQRMTMLASIMERPSIVYQFDDERLSTPPSTEYTYDETKPAGRRTAHE